MELFEPSPELGSRADANTVAGKADAFRIGEPGLQPNGMTIYGATSRK